MERPSSVVKELVENSIDAGATAITVEISGGGKKLIRITDNGSGMQSQQVLIAFFRHATSKIQKIEDLETIASLGFRGEALSSIAAVSQIELITKTPSDVSGTRYVIEGGQEKCMEEIGAPEGTTFLIRNLFFNTPARNKFLKSDTTEANYISTLMEQMALSHPEISFKYMQDKQVKLHTSGNYQIKDVIYQIYGREIAKALLEVHYENDFMKMEGFIGKPEISRGNRTFENYYINGRYIKNKIITKAIEDGYKGFLMQHKFPFVSLHIEMKGNDLDVNVHPQKMEVRFARGAEVYDAIYNTVRKRLTQQEMIPNVPLEEALPSKENHAETAFLKSQSFKKPIFETVPLETKLPQIKDCPPHQENTKTTFPKFPERREPAATPPKDTVKETSFYSSQNELEQPILSSSEESLFQGTLQQQKNKSEQKQDLEEKKDAAEKKDSKDFKQMELFEQKLLSPKSRIHHRLIGQLFDTYWLVQFGEQFYMIDQHAAHEKVYYERLVKQFQNHTIHSQLISPPFIISLNLQEEALLKANLHYFSEFGFEIEAFGGKEYCISAVPSELYGKTEQGLFLEMLDQLCGEEEKNTLELFTAKLASMACKAAVKGNQQMSAVEADKLIDELLTLENPYHCPHGRPTIISMTKQEIEKKFKRIV